MPVVTPRDIAEATTWLKKGLLRPLREAQMTDNGVIIGARKATLWERFKVTFVFDNKKIKQINNLNSQAWAVYAKNQSKRLEDMAVTEPPVDYTNYHLFDKNFDRLLRQGFFPIGDRSSNVTHEVEVKGERPKYNHGKLSQENKLFSQNNFPRAYWAKWSYSHSKTPLVNRIPLQTVVVGEGAAQVAGKHADQSSGWVALQFVEKEIDRRTTTRVTYSKREASYSTIPTSQGDVPPTEAPNEFSMRIDFPDKNGVIQSSMNTQWTLVKKTEKDIDNGGAWYKTQCIMPDGRENNMTRFFKLHEMVNQPRNLVVELQKGDKVVYAALLNKDSKLQWYERYYLANGKKTNWKASGLTPIQWKPNSIMEQVRHNNSGHATPAKKVQFGSERSVSFDVETPIEEAMQTAQFSRKKVKDQKPHHQLAHSYDDEYSARLNKLKKQTEDSIENLKILSKRTILTDEQKTDLARLEKIRAHIYQVIEKRSIFHAKAKDSAEVWKYAYGKKKESLSREKLRPTDAIEKELKLLDMSDLKLTRSHKEGEHRRVHTFTPHIMQDADWENQYLAQFAIPAVKNELLEALKDDAKRTEVMNATKVKGDRYVELSDGMKAEQDLLTEEEVGRAKLSKLSTHIDHLLVRAQHYSEQSNDLTEKLKLAIATYSFHYGRDTKADEVNHLALRGAYMAAENAQIELKSFIERLNVCQQEFLQQTQDMAYDLDEGGTQRTLARWYPNVSLNLSYDRREDLQVENAQAMITAAEELLSGVTPIPETITPSSSEETIYMDMNELAQPEPKGVYSLLDHEGVIDPSTRPRLELPEPEPEVEPELVDESTGEELYDTIASNATKAIQSGHYQEPPHPIAVLPPADNGIYSHIQAPARKVHFDMPAIGAFVEDANIVDDDEDELENSSHSSSVSELSINPNYEATQLVEEEELDQEIDDTRERIKILFEEHNLQDILKEFVPAEKLVKQETRVPPPLPPKEVITGRVTDV